jgi:2-oxoglutarate ferredoxin oxidoreductase subunit beta
MSQVSQLAQRADKYLEFESKNIHTWCSGCGNFGIIAGLKRALTLEGIEPQFVSMCYDVGCSGNESDKINTYTIHGLHGRVLPLSAGVVLANSRQEVIATAGDGATFSEGINHLVHSIRNNYPITFICHNNSNYGLTIGQASATTRVGQKMSGTSGLVEIEPLNTLQFVLSLNPGFVARTFSGKVEHITEMIQAGLNYPGFSYIEVMQVCPTFNHATPQEWYWDKLVDVSEIESYDKTDIWQARKIAENTEQLAIGVIYQNDNKTSFKTTQHHRDNLVTELVDEVQSFDITDLLVEFR